MTFNEKLSLFDTISHTKTGKIAMYYNSLILKQGDVVINTEDQVQQMYILKEGQLKVEKQVELTTLK